VFPKAVFLGVAMEWLLGDEDVFAVELDFWLEKAITFLDPVFLGAAMEWLLGDEDVWSVELEYRVKRAITCDPTVEMRSNFSTGFQRLFSLR